MHSQNGEEFEISLVISANFGRNFISPNTPLPTVGLNVWLVQPSNRSRMIVGDVHIVDSWLDTG